MPSRAPYIASCGCVVPSGTRCQHQRKRDAERKVEHDAKRPSARQRGYDKRWEFERRAWLKGRPNCRMCGQRATVVDHIIPHKGNKELFWRKSNWQPLCASCHSGRKQSQEARL